VRFLTPTENKRLNELIGFLCIVLGLLISGALLSYSPKDPSFNVAGSPNVGVQNWIGPIGSYGADGAFQLLGYAAFLLPMALLALGFKWFRSRAIESQVATLIGYALLVISIPSLLALVHFPEVRGAIPSGGVAGAFIAGMLLAALNKGAYIVAGALFVTALFLTTSFSFGSTHAWAMSSTGPIGAAQKLGILQKAQARWHAWREEREQRRMRRQVETNRTIGRKPAPAQSVGSGTLLNEPPKTIHMGEDGDVFRGVTSEEAEEGKSSHKAPILLLNPEKPEKAGVKKNGEPKIAKGNQNYKLPSISLLREGERSQKLDEDELKQRARAIEEKCLEFDVQGRVTQINPGPVVTTFEYKPEAGIKYSRIIGLTEDLCLALQAESILIERIPGKSTIGIEVPNIRRQTIALREILEAQEFVGSPSKLTLAMGRDLH